MSPERIAETRRLVALLAQTTNPYLIEAVAELLEEVERQAGLDEEIHAYGLQVARLQRQIRDMRQAEEDRLNTDAAVWVRENLGGDS